jgi:hypothetical protein
MFLTTITIKAAFRECLAKFLGLHNIHPATLHDQKFPSFARSSNRWPKDLDGRPLHRFDWDQALSHEHNVEEFENLITYIDNHLPSLFPAVTKEITEMGKARACKWVKKLWGNSRNALKKLEKTREGTQEAAAGGGVEVTRLNISAQERRSRARTVRYCELFDLMAQLLI